MTGVRALDHIVLSATDLVSARSRLGRLGFVVAPDARHPFGTENACVYLADGTYLEPLAIGSREDCETSAREGNFFTARDQACRFRQGPEGMSAIAFASHDAAVDDAAFHAAGFSGGRRLEFSRPLRMPDGNEGEASFRLAFASDLRAPDFHAFTCQRVNVPAVDRSALTGHDNGVVGLLGVALVEPNPSDFQYFLETVSDQRDVRATSFGVSLKTANSLILALTPEGFERHFGHRYPNGDLRGLRGRVVMFETGSLAGTAALFSRNGVVHQKIGNRLIVPAAPGQGVVYSFEEKA